MNAVQQADGCKGCAISREDCSEELVVRIGHHGGILRVGKWVLHHYTPRDPNEGFLGWLTLQPYEHREKLSHLSDRERESDGEQEEFGGILAAIEEALDAYWKKEFLKDPLEHVYVAYFQESSKHFHVHIVPRPKSFKDLHVCIKACSKFEEIKKTAEEPIGWYIHLASSCPGFPDRYRRNEQNTKRLMDYLKAKLALMTVATGRT